MKILAILSILISLALVGIGYQVSGIACYNGTIGYSVPNDADLLGWVILGAGVFQLIVAAVALLRTGSR